MTKQFQLSLLAAYLFAVVNCLVSAAPSAADRSLLRKAQIQFQKHGGVCICEDCRLLREQLKARRLIPGKLGERPAGKPLFEGPGLKRPTSPSPSPPSRPIPAKVTQQPKASVLHKVTTGRPLQPFRNIVFPPMARTPPVLTPPTRTPFKSPQNTTVVTKPTKRKTHGVRIPDPRPGALAQLAPQVRPSVPFGSPPGSPPSSRPPGPPPTFRPPPPVATSGGATGLPGRAVSIPMQTGTSGGLPGRPASIPPVQGLPGRPVTSQGAGGLPGRPLPTTFPQRPPNPQSPGGRLQAKIQAMIQKGVPPAAINKQTGIVRMNLQGQYLDAAGSVIIGRRQR